MSKPVVKLVNVDKLIDHPSNPRILEDSVKPVARSIEEFGFVNPIIINEQNIILAGHARRKAAEFLGIKKVPTIKVENLTKAQQLAYLLADNRLSENASYDNNMLADVIRTIDQMDFDTTITGFSTDEIDAFISASAENLDDLLGLNEDHDAMEDFNQEIDTENPENLHNMKRISFFFNENQHEIVSNAIESIKEKHQEKLSLGAALAIICAHHS